MLKLAQHYGDKPITELPMLFQRILSNSTLDWFRRQKTQNALFTRMSDLEASAGDDADFDWLETYADSAQNGETARSAEDLTERAQILQSIERDTGAAGASTRSIPDALLGRDGRCGDRCRDGVFRRKCKNTLFPRHPDIEQGTEGQESSHEDCAHLTLHSEMAADRIARRITARLGDGEALPYDITERLRAGRERALSVRRRELRAAPVQAASATQAQGGAMTLGSGDEGGTWWRALISAVPVLALIIGLVVVNVQTDQIGLTEVAEVDTALLTDDLPPAAYADPGFIQYLKTSATNTER